MEEPPLGAPAAAVSQAVNDTLLTILEPLCSDAEVEAKCPELLPQCAVATPKRQGRCTLYSRPQQRQTASALGCQVCPQFVTTHTFNTLQTPNRHNHVNT